MRTHFDLPYVEDASHMQLLDILCTGRFKDSTAVAALLCRRYEDGTLILVDKVCRFLKGEYEEK